MLFVNGIPLVVIECKDANEFTANPMDEAFQQLMRYSNQRKETELAGLRVKGKLGCSTRISC